MSGIEKFISPYIATQLPRIYRENGPMFVSFLKAYYEFLEHRRDAQEWSILGNKLRRRGGSRYYFWSI